MGTQHISMSEAGLVTKQLIVPKVNKTFKLTCKLLASKPYFGVDLYIKFKSFNFGAQPKGVTNKLSVVVLLIR